MAFMWALGDSMLDFHRGDRTRHTMQRLVIWARLVAHLRPQSCHSKRRDRLAFQMAEQKDYDKVAAKLHKITGELPQTWVKANEGFIVILVSDSSKKSQTSFPVLVHRRKKPDGTDLITNEMVLAALEASADRDPGHANESQEHICFGDERYRSVNEVLAGHLGITINNTGHDSTCRSIWQTLTFSAMYQENETINIRKIHLSPLQRASAASVLLGHLNKENGWY